MIDKFTIGILLLAFILSISMVIYEAGRINDLEKRIAVLTIQIEEAEKNSRIARQISKRSKTMTMTRDEVLTAEEVEGKDKEKQITELEKEARFRTKGWKEQENCVQAYLAGAKPREKRIAELEAENDDIYDALNTASLKISELEAQIEKMKCWCNCKNYISCLEEYCRKNISFEKGICYNCKKWELRR